MALPVARMDGTVIQQALFRIASLREGLETLRTCFDPDDNALKILQNILNVDNMRAEQMKEAGKLFKSEHLKQPVEYGDTVVGGPGWSERIYQRQFVGNTSSVGPKLVEGDIVAVQVGNDVVVFTNADTNHPDTITEPTRGNGFVPAKDDDPNDIPHIRV